MPSSPTTESTRTLRAGRHRPFRGAATGAIALLLVTAAAACGSSDPTAETSASSSTVAPGQAPIETTTTLPTTTAPPATAPPVDVGTLEQTDEEPTATGAEWDANVEHLWKAIVDDDPEAARPFFFPEGAYLQVKRMTEAEATADYANRLIAYYEQDIHALHQQLGADAAKAELVGLRVAGAPQWIQPGVEYNKGSYWRVLDSQLVYTVGGVERSFLVKSMISWRGQWYVVHLSSIR